MLRPVAGPPVYQIFPRRRIASCLAFSCLQSFSTNRLMPGRLPPASPPADCRLLPQRHAAGPPGHYHLRPEAGGGGAQPRRPAGRPAGRAGRGRQRVQEQVGCARTSTAARGCCPRARGAVLLLQRFSVGHTCELLMLCCLHRYLPPAPQGAAHQHLPGHAVRQAGDQRGQGQRPQVRAVPRRAAHCCATESRQARCG